MMTDRITANHLKRAAIVYVRQSSPEQVRHHAESTRIQVGLRDKAIAFGWRDPVTILDDLGISAGGFAQFIAKEGDRALLRLPSGEVRKVPLDCMATIGQVGNLEHENISLGKAGRSRWLGIRPSVRGVAMNPHDHPLGGGEGKSSGGRHPCSPWGKVERKTRRKRAQSSRDIVKRRK